VDGLHQGLLDIIVTSIAMLGLEERLDAFVNMGWIGVDVTI
jgi:hypothetical protein